MVPRKRGRAEMEASEPAPENSLLTKLRNMWEFANIMQYIFIFGKAVKIDEDFDIEVPPALPLLLSNPADPLSVGAFAANPLCFKGLGSRMLEAWLIRQACRDRSLPPQVRVVASGTYVSPTSYGQMGKLD